MTWRRAILIASLVALGAASVAPSAARADDEAKAKRLRAAEHDMLDGRIRLVEDAVGNGTTALERLPLVLADHWWRIAAPSEETPDPAGADELTTRRLAWARARAYEPPYPVPGGGAEDPLPLLTALMQDRIHRETIGWNGLVVPADVARQAIRGTLDDDPEAKALYELVELTSPLRRYLKQRGDRVNDNERKVIVFTLDMQQRSYVGDEDPAYEARQDKKANLAANQARVVYLGLLGSLLVSAYLATLFVSRDRRKRPGTPA